MTGSLPVSQVFIVEVQHLSLISLIVSVDVKHHVYLLHEKCGTCPTLTRPLPVSQMFIVDSISMREKCSAWMASCCKLDRYEYAAIESELKDDPSWPPVSHKSIDLASAFQRLDSVHQIPPDQSVTNGVSSRWHLLL